MSIIYLDPRALVKQYVQESASKDVQQLIKTTDRSDTSLITRAELAAPMARASRMKLISSGSLE